MRVAYRDNPAIAGTVNLIRSWERGEIAEPTMSTSSGPKATIRNHIFAIFERYPHVGRVLMVIGKYSQSVPFLLVVDEAGQFFDMAGKEVVVDG
ncbi:MAG TPA: hypothetical protein VE030_11025 [Burkholderiales bacterium]|nr:hypothetical protein [Burkholderiales bacterium]